jgi:DNA ligase D-like protein (predicted 3'-phosphoesterase)
MDRDGFRRLSAGHPARVTTRKDQDQADRLAEYRRRRDPTRSPEPPGRDGAADGGKPVFVVQLHDASTMHFDFRLEADGVLKSWAVPKGPSSDPQTKRLASPTEDHPMDYRSFEGVIPKGEYGGGTVMVWDEGTYRNLSKKSGREVPLSEALEKGHASFWLDGHKLHGAFALTRMRADDNGREAWLLVKKSGRHAGTGRALDPRRLRSARSGRTLRQIADEEGDSC